jgi:hypothetical protein
MSPSPPPPNKKRLSNNGTLYADYRAVSSKAFDSAEQ